MSLTRERIQMRMTGVEDASDMDSDAEERHIENLIKKYL